MTALAPLQTLYDTVPGDDMPLPTELATLYGRFAMPAHRERPYVIGNFVTTLDGVVSLNVPGQSGGGPISGFDEHDRMVMGLLRAAADAVIVGAGTVRGVSPRHIWSADYIYPPLAAAYRELRRRLQKPAAPLNVVVTARGDLDLSLRVFQSGDVPVLIVTTRRGVERIPTDDLPSWVQVAPTDGADSVPAQAILTAVRTVQAGDLILVEGGPKLMGDFFAEQCLDELFLTLAPQIAGRDTVERPGLIAGKQFAPEHPIWGTLAGLKRGANHLFMRYQFTPGARPPAAVSTAKEDNANEAA
jgi:riboflavin biosynthesis pyrimidine reductase